MNTAPIRIALRLVAFWLLITGCGGGGGGDSGTNGATTGSGTAATVSCAGLAGRTVNGAQINSSSETTIDGIQACVVNGRVDPAVNFQLTIPCYWNGKLLVQGNGGFGGSIPSPTATNSPGMLGNAQLAACDALDGLTDEEITTFKLVRSPTPLAFAQANGLTAYPGYPPGHEEFGLSWPLWLTEGNPTATPPQLPIKMIAQPAFVRYFIVGDPNADPLQVNLANYATALERESRRIDATDPNLGPFFDRGGKLILWHGTADPAISINNTTAYFDAVRAARGAQADTNLRYYTAPGVLHCTFGTGADNVDLMTPLARWVENGTAPENGIVARRYPFGPGGTPLLTSPPILSRPLCRYPQFPHYNGAGDTTDAASFSCRTP